MPIAGYRPTYLRYVTGTYIALLLIRAMPIDAQSFRRALHIIRCHFTRDAHTPDDGLHMLLLHDAD